MNLKVSIMDLNIIYRRIKMKLKNITIVFISLALNSINGMTTSHGNNPQKNKYFSS
jgi:hypothetical protein